MKHTNGNSVPYDSWFLPALRGFLSLSHSTLPSAVTRATRSLILSHPSSSSNPFLYSSLGPRWGLGLNPVLLWTLQSWIMSWSLVPRWSTELATKHQAVIAWVSSGEVLSCPLCPDGFDACICFQTGTLSWALLTMVHYTDFIPSCDLIGQ